MHDNHHLQSTVAYQNTGQTVLSRRATALLRLRRIRYQVHTKYIYIFMQMRAHHRYSCTWTCSWYYDFWSYTCTGTGSTIWLLCIARIVARCAVLSRCARQSALDVNLKAKNWVRTGRKHWWCICTIYSVDSFQFWFHAYTRQNRICRLSIDWPVWDGAQMPS